MQHLASFVRSGIGGSGVDIYQSTLWHGWNRESLPKYSLAINAQGSPFGLMGLAATATEKIGAMIAACADVELINAPVTLAFDVDPLDPGFDLIEFRGGPMPRGTGPIEAWAKAHRTTSLDPRIGPRVVVLPRMIHEYDDDGSIPIDTRGCQLYCDRVHLNPSLVERHGLVATFPGLLMNDRVYEIARPHLEESPFTVVNHFDV